MGGDSVIWGWLSCDFFILLTHFHSEKKTQCSFAQIALHVICVSVISFKLLPLLSITLNLSTGVISWRKPEYP